MDLGLQDKVALVTAASQGLGRGVAMALAREGARLVICARQSDTLEQAAAAIRQQTGAQVLTVVADVSRADDVARLVAEAVAASGRLDILVANSGGPPAGPFLEITDDQWALAVQLNLMSVVRLARAATPHLRASGAGRIVVVASASVKVPQPSLVLSNTLRAGLAGLVKTLAAELAPQILVNIAAPARIDTDRLRSLEADWAARAGRAPAEIRAGTEREIPLGRYGTPDEFGRYVAFLASPANSYVTGSVLMIDGGMVRAL